MRGGEKSFYKELNRANEIRFPVKVDVALPSHKVSLILQAHLGSVLEPAGPNYDKHHAQYHTDTSVVFAHANRLIRCIIDCQLSQRDSVSAKNALELARGLAARAWDNTPNMLKQVQGIGDVYMRKLAAKGVNSVDTLLTTDPQRINLILGKPQPFGNSLLKKLSSFPNLMVGVKEMDRKIWSGKGVTLKLKCEVGFLNETTPYQFGRTQVHVCFLLEDSNGLLLDFRRFGAHKLENGKDIFVTAELTKPTAFLRSHVMCDEIAGTSRYAEIHLADIPATIFPQPTQIARDRDAEPPAQRITEAFDDDGVGDDELLAASNVFTKLKDGIEIVQDIDDLMQEENAAPGAKRKHNPSKRPSFGEDHADRNEFRDSAQMENGRWTCQHLCKEKGIECKHKCCKEGVVKPRRRSKKAVKVADGEEKQQKLTGMANVTKKSSKAAAACATSLGKLHQTNSSFTAAQAGYGKEPSKVSANTGKKRKLSSIDDLDNDYDLRVEKSGEDEWDADDCDWYLPPSFQARESAVVEPHGGATIHTLDQAYKDIDKAYDDIQPATEDDRAPRCDTIAEGQLKLEKPFLINGKSSSPTNAAQDRSIAPILPSSGRIETPLVAEDLIDDEITTRNMDIDQELPVLSHRGDLALTRLAVRSIAEEDVKAEAEEGKKNGSWEEDQKRKWDQLEPWMFEEFGSFVELI